MYRVIGDAYASDACTRVHVATLVLACSRVCAAYALYTRVKTRTVAFMTRLRDNCNGHSRNAKHPITVTLFHS